MAPEGFKPVKRVTSLLKATVTAGSHATHSTDLFSLGSISYANRCLNSHSASAVEVFDNALVSVCLQAAIPDFNPVFGQHLQYSAQDRPEAD